MEDVETSNLGEYQALHRALTYILSLKYYDVHLVIYGDSELVRNQVGTFHKNYWEPKNKCNHAHLQSMRDKVRSMLASLHSFRYDHVPRKSIVKLLGH